MKQTNLSTNRLTTRENRPVVAKIEGAPNRPSFSYATSSWLDSQEGLSDLTLRQALQDANCWKVGPFPVPVQGSYVISKFQGTEPA